ncbi:hypothetical protein ABZ801_15980 [Actinomadura sp. NPDC047616]|uniref:hypothetical protein n=1 Tax=Actinomadura sp. NPDC047616 TaxID=3155914 RepID=UPI0033EE7C8F
MPKTMLTVVILACAVLAGCTNGERAAPAPFTSTPTTPPVDGGYFTEPREIVAKSMGTLPCQDLTETRQLIGARAQVTCSDGDIVVRVHENHQGVDAQVRLLKFTGGDLLMGQNWTVNASPDVLSAAQKHLGGRIQHIPCEEPDCALADS